MLTASQHCHCTSNLQSNVFSGRNRLATVRKATVVSRGVQTTRETSASTQQGLIFQQGAPGSWDAGGVSNPVVKCFVGDNEQRWSMWYSGKADAVQPTDAFAPSSGSIGIAVSSDGVNWRRGSGPVSGTRGEEADSDVGVVLGPSEDKWALDTCHLNASDVQVFSNSSVSGGVGIYWMFYSGGDFEPVPAPPQLPGLQAGEAVEGLRMRPGLAMSQDGRHWARIEGEHHTNAILDVGLPGEWDALFIASPKVVAAGPRDMRMYYTSYSVSDQRWLVGLATSPDGFKWTKRGVMFKGGTAATAPDAKGVAAVHVVRDVDTKKFLMFYEAVGADNRRSICLATSDNGIVGWKRVEQPLLEASGEDGAWDAGSVGAPWAVPMSAGRYRLYYCGRRSMTGPWEGIGLALSSEAAPGQVPMEFKRRAAAQQ